MLNKQQLEKAFHLLCSAEEAARVSWRVVGMRAALLSYAFATHFVIKSREDARLALGLSEQDWVRFGDGVLEHWQESVTSGQLMLSPPKAPRQPRSRKDTDNFSRSSFGNALPLSLAPSGPRKVIELPGETAARATEELFNAVWAAYPNKTNKTYAFTCFKRLNATPDEVRAILRDLKLRVFTKKWTDSGGEFVPNPSTYFNNRVWTEPIMLTELELAVSVLPVNERAVFFAKPKREIESWLGSQKVLRRIPTQSDLLAHVDGTGTPQSRFQEAAIVEVRPSNAGAADALVVRQQNASTALAPSTSNLIDPFEVEFANAVSTVTDPEKRSRIMERDAKGKRDWLNTWKTMRASGSSRSSLSAARPTASAPPANALPSTNSVQHATGPTSGASGNAAVNAARGHNMFERQVWM